MADYRLYCLDGVGKIGTGEWIEAKGDADLATDVWRRTFRGRDVLMKFAADHSKASYDVFRSLIIARMSDANYRPQGMKLVIDQILAE